MGRINMVCEFGVVHEIANCRCMNNHVTTRQIKCPTPDEHNKPVKTLREHLEETVDAFWGPVMMPIVREAFLDKLEQDVSDWLLDFPKHKIKE